MKTTNNIKFHIFDSKKMDYNVLPNVAGNYIFLLREGAVLPQVGIAPVITKVEQSCGYSLSLHVLQPAYPVPVRVHQTILSASCRQEPG